MGETYHCHQASSRLGIRRSGLGEIVEVQGGHIVRSTGRKDRHSKVCTAKGPRDRRVRLSAHTAIQFYDVQDRLGYDRPSKAVDWLIKKAKNAIDELTKLPVWKPSNVSTEDMDFGREEIQKQGEDNHQDLVHNQHQKFRIVDEGDGSNAVSFLPSGLHSDSLADTIKSFFPMGSLPEGNTSAMQFQSFKPPDSLLRSQSQDLRLTLQSFQDSVLLHHQNPPSHTDQELVQAQAQAEFFTGTTPLQLGFDGSGWPHRNSIQKPNELGQFHKLASLNIHSNTGSTNGGAGGGYSYNSRPLTSSFQPFLGQNQIHSQRGPLQSSYPPPVRAQIDPPLIAIPTTEHQAMLLNYQSSLSGIGCASGVNGFSGCFHIPARIQGDEEEHDGMSDKPSSDSHH